MPLILCIETSSTNCSIALANDQGGYSNLFGVNSCLDLLEDQSDSYTHAESLHVFIDRLLNKNGYTSKDLDAIAVSKGPGSYTGLRIGVATAKGLCFALDVPLLSIDTLQALSLQGTNSGTIIPMMDARRMEVYTAVYQEGNQLEGTDAIVLQKSTYAQYLAQPARPSTIIGTGALKFKELLDDVTNDYISALPTALTMCDLALDLFNRQTFVDDIAYYEPFYLKEFKSN